jgi:membrane protein DedA with SNARE-associated domain
MRRGGAKLSEFFNRFCPFFSLFRTFLAIFRTFSHFLTGFNRFKTRTLVRHSPLATADARLVLPQIAYLAYFNTPLRVWYISN